MGKQTNHTHKQACADSPATESFESLQETGLCYLNNKSFNKALYFYERSLPLVSNGSQKEHLWNLIGNIYFMQNNFSLAEASYDEAIKINPSGKALLNKIMLYLSAGNFYKAQSLTKTIETPPFEVYQKPLLLSINHLYPLNEKSLRSEEYSDDTNHKEIDAFCTILKNDSLKVPQQLLDFKPEDKVLIALKKLLLNRGPRNGTSAQ